MDLNPKSQYTTIASIGPFSGLFTGLSYDESDIFVKLFQVSETVLYYPLQTLSFDQWYAAFMQQYLTPGFHQLIDTIKSNIYNKLQQINMEVEDIITIILVIQGIIVLIWFIVAIFKLTKVINSFVSIM